MKTISRQNRAIKKQKPKFSIIVPMYNSEKEIKRCIESVLNQNNQDYELILIDDGSTDRTLDICHELEKNNRQVQVVSKKHAGVSATRNEGLQRSSGDWVMFVDSDDELDEKCLNVLDKCISEKKCEIYSFNNKATERNVVLNITEKNIKNVIFSIMMWKENMFFNIGPSVCGCAFERNLVKNTFFNTNLNTGEDMLFKINAFYNSKNVYLIKEELYHIHTRNNSVSRGLNRETLLNDESFHMELFEIIEKTCPKILDFVKIRSPLGGILNCCNSYFYRLDYNSFNDKLDKFLDKSIYRSSLININLVREQLFLKEFLHLVLLKNKKLRPLAFLIKNFNYQRIIFLKKNR